LQINASIQYIDFEGRTDGESIYKLMTGLRPRRVILVGTVSIPVVLAEIVLVLVAL
jgi:hypothetical protein